MIEVNVSENVNISSSSDEPLESNFWGTGWAFPIVFNAGDFKVETSSRHFNIEDSIRVLLGTSKGERSNNLNFGSGLNQFLFSSMNETLKGDIIQVVKDSLLKYEPRIHVLKVDVEFKDELSGLVEISINYEINHTNTRHNLVYPFYLNEATNL